MLYNVDVSNYGDCYYTNIQISRLKEDEGAVPSAVAEAHRKQLEEFDEVVRKEQQVSPNEVKEGVRAPYDWFQRRMPENATVFSPLSSTSLPAPDGMVTPAVFISW